MCFGPGEKDNISLTVAREMSKAKGKVGDFLGDVTTEGTLGTGHRNAADRTGSMRWKKRESRGGEISGLYK